jgi:hypothetical protein
VIHSSRNDVVQIAPTFQSPNLDGVEVTRVQFPGEESLRGNNIMGFSETLFLNKGGKGDVGSNPAL